MKQSDFKTGERWRVTRPGAVLRGFRPDGRNCEVSHEIPLLVGEIITARQTYFRGEVPIIVFDDPCGNPLMNDCQFKPDNGETWTPAPADGYLERVA